MPITTSAKKALRVSKRRQAINYRVRSKMKTFIDRLITTPTSEHLSLAFSAVDRAAKMNIISKNKAGRIKSRLHKLAPSVASASAPKKTTHSKTKPVAKKATTKKTATKKAA